MGRKFELRIYYEWIEEFIWTTNFECKENNMARISLWFLFCIKHIKGKEN